MKNELQIVSAIVPESNFGGLEISPIFFGNSKYGAAYYRRNWGENAVDKWHKTQVHFSTKGAYLKMYGRRYYLHEMLTVRSGRGFKA